MSEAVIGNPWHGTYSAAGLTLADATLHAEWIADSYRPTDTYYAAFGMPAAPTPTALEASLGMVWENDMVLSGGTKYWSPAGLQIGLNGWLYRAADGTVFKIFIGYVPATGAGTVYAQRVVGSAANILTFSLPVDPSSAPTMYVLNQSPTGDRCILSVGKTSSAATSTGATYSFTSKYDTFCEFTVSGGSATVMPSCSSETLYDYTTVIDDTFWINPAGHTEITTPRDTFDERIWTNERIIFAGYNKTGLRQVVSAKWTKREMVTTVGPNYREYRLEELDTWVNQVLVNGEEAFAAPTASAHVIKDLIANPVTGAIEVTYIVNELLNLEYYGEAFVMRHLSNCLVAFAITSDAIAYYDVLHAQSLNGPVPTPNAIVGTQFGGYDLDSLTLAAYNPRNDAVALGIKVGFI